MSAENAEEIRTAVRENYASVAGSGGSSPCCSQTDPCGSPGLAASEQSELMGYSSEELAELPEGANLGLGCGNPQAIAALSPGETVLDLGSGAGIDCFLAARKVGADGLAIGVDMTPEMLAKARRYAKEGGFENVDFRLGEIENLPVADGTVDVILSNCVINLSPDKRRVFAEAFRVLASGGRLAISDVVATAEMPQQIRDDIALLCGCVAGAAHIDDVRRMLAQVGFLDIRVHVDESSRKFIAGWSPGKGVENYVASATIEAVKP